MTISVTDSTLDMEKRTIEDCRKRNCLFWIGWIYCGIFFISFVIFYTFWYTDTFNNYVQSQMQLRNGTNTFDWWQHPPTRLKYNIYIFNYTNVDEFEAGTADKLRVQELGPYTYRENLIRTNVMLHDNGTVTFQSKRSYKWTGGQSSNENIIVPNVLLMSTLAYVRDMGFAMRFFINTVLSTLQESSFINITVDGFLWGYDTQLFELAKPLIKLDHDIPFEKFGIMASKNGIDMDRLTMGTGSRNLENLGMIERVNGMDNRHIWDDERCDKIEGTDGSMFPPKLVEDKNKSLYVYSKDICRNIPFRFTEQVTTFGIPSLRYKFTPDVYNFSNKENECFCPKMNNKRVCPPSGLLNISACMHGSPILSSFPHFYGADKSLLEQIDGLNPRQEDHETYVDIHPRLGNAIAGWSRVQVNLEVRKAIGMPFLGNLKDGMILPLIWIEIGVDELPENILDILHVAYFTTVNLELGFQWGSLITMIFSLCSMIACFWKYSAKQKAIRRNELF